MDDRDAHDASVRRRLELPRRQPGEEAQEGDGGWAEGLLPGIPARAEMAGEASPPDRGAAPDRAAPSETTEPGTGTAALRPGTGTAVGGDVEPRPPFRTPEEMLAAEDWPERPGGGEIWDSAAAPGEDHATASEPPD